MSWRALSCGALLLGLSSSCLTVQHFDQDPSAYDGLYFGDAREAPAEPELTDEWIRVYALLGFMTYGHTARRWAGERLGEVSGDERPMRIVVNTRFTVGDGAGAFGALWLAGPLQPLLFVPRTTRVRGWREE